MVQISNAEHVHAALHYCGKPFPRRKASDAVHTAGTRQHAAGTPHTQDLRKEHRTPTPRHAPHLTSPPPAAAAAARHISWCPPTAKLRDATLRLALGPPPPSIHRRHSRGNGGAGDAALGGGAGAGARSGARGRRAVAAAASGDDVRGGDGEQKGQGGGGGRGRVGALGGAGVLRLPQVHLRRRHAPRPPRRRRRHPRRPRPAHRAGQHRCP